MLCCTELHESSRRTSYITSAIFRRVVMSRFSTGNLHNLLNTPDSLDAGRLKDRTPENETILLQTRSVGEIQSHLLVV